MKATELLLFLLVGWTAIGVVGVVIRMWRGERQIARRHAAWIAGVWAIYLAILLVVSRVQPQHEVKVGQEQCFDEMCFAVTGVDRIPGFLIRDNSHLLRVKVRITNRGRKGPEAEKLLRAYLVDGQGHRWKEIRGLSGNKLTDRVPAGGTVVCEPVYRVRDDAGRVGLVLTHGRWQPGRLVIGDSDSLLHRRTVVWLSE